MIIRDIIKSNKDPSRPKRPSKKSLTRVRTMVKPSRGLMTKVTIMNTIPEKDGDVFLDNIHDDLDEDE